MNYKNWESSEIDVPASAFSRKESFLSKANAGVKRIFLQATYYDSKQSWSVKRSCKKSLLNLSLALRNVFSSHFDYRCKMTFMSD